jgi:hypothetical protein
MSKAEELRMVLMNRLEAMDFKQTESKKMRTWTHVITNGEPLVMVMGDGWERR